MGPRRALLRCEDIKSISTVAKSKYLPVSAVVEHAPAASEGMQKTHSTCGSTLSAITGQAQVPSRQKDKNIPGFFYIAYWTTDVSLHLEIPRLTPPLFFFFFFSFFQ